MPIPQVPSQLLMILAAKTYNAAWFSGTSVEQQIQNAITQAANDGATYVFIPANMFGFNESLVTFNNTVQMIREGGRFDVFDVWAYGANHDGANDDGPAISAAIKAAASHGVAGVTTVYIPAGTYSIKTNIVLNAVVDIKIEGAGANETLLAMGANGVTIFQTSGVCTRVQFRDMWIGSFSVWTTGGGIQSINPGYPLTPTSDIVIERCTFQNLPNPLYFDNVQQASLRNLVFKQTMVNATVGVVFYMIRSVSIDLDVVRWLVTTGSWPADTMRIDSDCDTIICRHCESVLGGNGAGSNFAITDSVGAGTHPARIIRFTDCSGENMQSGWTINTVRDCVIAHCETANSTLSGITIIGGNGIKVIGCQSFLNQQHGIVVTGGTGITLIGNICSNNSQQTTNTYSGIWTNAVGVRIIDNTCGDIFFTLANKQKNGVDLEASAENCIVFGNDLRSNNNAPFVNFSGGLLNLITRNIGVTPSGVSAITVTASPFTYTNLDQVPEMVYIFGGTVTTVAKNGVTIFSHGGTAVPGDAIWLEPNESVTVTYTGAPTMNKDKK